MRFEDYYWADPQPCQNDTALGSWHYVKWVSVLPSYLVPTIASVRIWVALKSRRIVSGLTSRACCMVGAWCQMSQLHQDSDVIATSLLCGADATISYWMLPPLLWLQYLVSLPNFSRAECSKAEFEFYLPSRAPHVPLDFSFQENRFKYLESMRMQRSHKYDDEPLKYCREELRGPAQESRKARRRILLPPMNRRLVSSSSSLWSTITMTTSAMPGGCG